MREYSFPDNGIRNWVDIASKKWEIFLGNIPSLGRFVDNERDLYDLEDAFDDDPQDTDYFPDKMPHRGRSDKDLSGDGTGGRVGTDMLDSGVTDKDYLEDPPNLKPVTGETESPMQIFGLWHALQARKLLMQRKAEEAEKAACIALYLSKEDDQFSIFDILRGAGTQLINSAGITNVKAFMSDYLAGKASSEAITKAITKLKDLSDGHISVRLALQYLQKEVTPP